MTNDVAEAIAYLLPKIEEMKNSFPRYEDGATEHLETVVQAAQQADELKIRIDMAEKYIEIQGKENDDLRKMCETLAKELNVLALYHGPGTCPNYNEMNEALIAYQEMVGK